VFDEPVPPDPGAGPEIPQGTHMQLIGMLDSPYVRRVAISLQRLGLAFEHRSISVFRAFEQFHALNPVVKAPSLVCDDGTVLMDSTLILDYAESIAAPGRKLMPEAARPRQQALRTIGLALAACEKSVQLIYESQLRPADKQHQPWVDRVTGQLRAAYAALEAESSPASGEASSAQLDQATITLAVAWHFSQQTLPELLPATEYPALVRLSEAAERLLEFRAAPYGDATYPAA
jgi:glutathione S-transferase